ncbi:hypothetical protein HK096_006382 [Nowakowskiella sp. JEL0078]|nr:hypothetical protein HK096_006382 [Nowakowskiella sp. JEL0078]
MNKTIWACTAASSGQTLYTQSQLLADLVRTIFTGIHLISLVSALLIPGWSRRMHLPHLVVSSTTSILSCLIIGALHDYFLWDGSGCGVRVHVGIGFYYVAALAWDLFQCRKCMVMNNLSGWKRRGALVLFVIGKIGLASAVVATSVAEVLPNGVCSAMMRKDLVVSERAYTIVLNAIVLYFTWGDILRRVNRNTIQSRKYIFQSARLLLNADFTIFLLSLVFDSISLLAIIFMIDELGYTVVMTWAYNSGALYLEVYHFVLLHELLKRHVSSKEVHESDINLTTGRFDRPVADGTLRVLSLNFEEKSGNTILDTQLASIDDQIYSPGLIGRVSAQKMIS